MKSTKLIPVALLLSATSSLLLSACDHAAVEAQTAPVVAAAPKHEPTSARLLERANVRWTGMTKGDWVSVHDLLVPEMKREIPLARYLGQTQFHTYANAKVGEVVAIEKENAYVRSSALWTPTHPDVQRVKLEPGQTLTQELKVVESWRWVGGDWCFQKMQTESEFFGEHPDLLKVASKQ